VTAPCVRLLQQLCPLLSQPLLVPGLQRDHTRLPRPRPPLHLGRLCPARRAGVRKLDLCTVQLVAEQGRLQGGSRHLRLQLLAVGLRCGTVPVKFDLHLEELRLVGCADGGFTRAILRECWLPRGRRCRRPAPLLRPGAAFAACVARVSHARLLRHLPLELPQPATVGHQQRSPFFRVSQCAAWKSL